MNFYGNKLLFCTKEEFDKLTLEQMEGVDTAVYVGFGIHLPIDYFNVSFGNKEFSNQSLCLNAAFSVLRHLNNSIGGVFSKEGTFAVNAFDYDRGFKYYINNRITIESHCGQETYVKYITKLGNATLYDIYNNTVQHWVCEKGNNHNIPKDKSVNVHEYYDVIVNENSVECTVDFFEKGVGKTQSCGSGAFCVGMHLFKIHGKEVVVKTKNGDKYFVNENTISIEI